MSASFLKPPAILLLVTLTPSAGFTSETEAVFQVADTYTDNAGLTETNRQSDQILSAVSKFSFARQSPLLDSRLSTTLRYVHYVDNSFSDQFQRALSAGTSLRLAEGRFAWVATEDYIPLLADQMGSVRPDNWVYDNYFATGPELQFGGPGEFHVNLGGRVGFVNHELSIIPDSRQYTGTLTLALPQPATAEKSLNLKYERVNLDVARPSLLLSHYATAEAFLRYAVSSRRSTLFLEAGASSLVTPDERSTSPLVRLGLQRQVSSMVKLRFSGGTEYQESVGRLLRLQNPTGTPGGVISSPRPDATESSDPFREKYLRAQVAIEGRRTQLDLSASYNHLRFDPSATLTGSENYIELAAQFRRRVTPTLTLQISSTYDRRTFSNTSAKDNEQYLSIGASWQMFPKLAFVIDCFRDVRSGNSRGSDYKANFVQLQLDYRPLLGRSAESRR